MNLFFQAFPGDDLKAMEGDHSIVDGWVEDGERCALSMDIGDAWSILNKLLGGTGFRSSQFFDDVLFNGCEVVEPAMVTEYAAQLSEWSHEKLLEGLRGLGEKDDVYHLEHFQDEEQDLLDEFDKLAAFYREAAAKGLGVIHYAA